ncbi:MAG: FtsX-like permease family protein [Planctomycetes bacterium]|nr:FtsX-like permease family protein [Planctomycetota bacterium]
MKYAFLIFETIRHNLIRTILTGLGTMVMVLVVTLVFTVLSALDRATTEKQKNLKAIVTEKWQIPSMMPYSYASALSQGGAAADDPDAARPEDAMSWGFFVGSTEENPAKRSFENLFFAFIMEPEKARTMLDEVDSLTDDEAQPLLAAIKRMKDVPNGVIVGQERLDKMKKKVGDRITVFGRNYRDMNLELEIVGTFPREPARYADSSVISRDYFNRQLDAYQNSHQNKPHPMAEKTLGLVWLRLKDRKTFSKVSEQILTSPSFTSPPVKIETSSTGIGGFLEAWRDIIWGMRWLMAPACLLTLSLVISNAISISVRERQLEFAVMKVMGFRPSQILILVLAEALLIGTISGFLSAALTYVAINGMGGLPFRIAFFPKFAVPLQAFWWGPAMGAITALAGSFIPAWRARTVKVSDVFARVT